MRGEVDEGDGRGETAGWSWWSWSHRAHAFMGPPGTALLDRGLGPEAQRKQAACLGTWAAGAKPDSQLRALGGALQPGRSVTAPRRVVNSQGRRAGCCQGAGPRLEPLGAPRHHATTARAGATRGASEEHDGVAEQAGGSSISRYSSRTVIVQRPADTPAGSELGSLTAFLGSQLSRLKHKRDGSYRQFSKAAPSRLGGPGKYCGVGRTCWS